MENIKVERRLEPKKLVKPWAVRYFRPLHVSEEHAVQC